jgi:hypothetical protein
VVKEKWCGNFKGGKCQVLVGDQKPRLAKEHADRESVVKPEEITDPFRIVSALSFMDPDRLWGGEEFPKQIKVNWPDEVIHKYYTCTASNCRNSQKKCDQYRKQ